MANEALTDLKEEISTHLNRIAALFKNPRLTLIVRNPDLADGDVTLSNDDPEEAIAALRKMETRAQTDPNVTV